MHRRSPGSHLGVTEVSNYRLASVRRTNDHTARTPHRHREREREREREHVFEHPRQKQQRRTPYAVLKVEKRSAWTPQPKLPSLPFFLPSPAPLPDLESPIEGEQPSPPFLSPFPSLFLFRRRLLKYSYGSGRAL